MLGTRFPQDSAGGRGVDLRSVGCEDPAPPPPDYDPDRPEPPPRIQWEHLSPLLFGVVFPAVAITAAGIMNFESLWHMIVRRPVETIIEMGFLIAVPILNQRLWTAFAVRDGKHPVRVGIYAGISIAVSALVFAVSSVCLGMVYPTIDETGHSHSTAFSLIATVALGSLAVGLICVELIRRTKLTRAARVRSVMYSLIGVLLTLIAGIACETQPIRMRLAERSATSSDVPLAERENGLAYLRQSNPDRDLWMDCADPATAGLSGLFIKFDAGTRSRLYFATTGKPYVDARAGDLEKLTDDSLSRHVIGEKADDLSLHRSAFTGFLHADGLVSTVDWTFVFKNEQFRAQEARAEIALPQGGVISGLTLWINGEPRQAAFGNATTVSAAYHGTELQKRDPALVTDLGRGRVLLQCFPIPSRGEARVAVQVTAPLKLDNPKEASLVLPRFVNSNFAVSGSHSLRLRSDHDFMTSFEGVRTVPTDMHDYLLTGSLKDNQLTGSGIAVRVQHDPKARNIVVRDTNPKARAPYVTSSVQESLAMSPQRVVVVVDGSQAMAPYKKDVLDALATIPHHIAASVVWASQAADNLEPIALNEFLRRGPDLKFAGGQDNLEALIKAAELAGETKRSAVVWLHGPQPSFNREMYILAPYMGKPSFYELPLDDGWTNTSEFLSNHKEIGPFTPIIRNASVRDDLQRFFEAWKPGAKTYTMVRVHSKSDPSPSMKYSSDPELTLALSRLAVHEECRKLMSRGKVDETVALASSYHLVNKCTGAVVLERTGDYVRYGLQDPNAEPGDEFAVNNAATNGGASGQDATVIMGINTAGTVRVNNLANLEALLNIVANGIELVGVLFGLSHIICALCRRPLDQRIFGMGFSTGPVGRFVFGFMVILGGLAVPGCINWLIASARDANLFS